MVEDPVLSADLMVVLVVGCGCGVLPTKSLMKNMMKKKKKRKKQKKTYYCDTDIADIDIDTDITYFLLRWFFFSFQKIFQNFENSKLATGETGPYLSKKNPVFFDLGSAYQLLDLVFFASRHEIIAR